MSFLRTARIAAGLAAAAFIVSCGGGSGGTATGSGNATVGVLITDAPTSQWDQAIATITSVQLLGAAGQVTLFSGSETLDLLKLADFSELFAVSDEVPAGSYSKIRLRLADLVLNDVDPGTGAIVESVHPRLVGNGKIDLNPRGPFRLESGDVIFIQLDFDMEKSLKLTTTGNGRVILRPVVFVAIHTAPSVGRLPRIHGEITDINAADGSLRLCRTDFASRWDDPQPQPLGDGDDGDHGFAGDHCVTVDTGADTGIFDADGLPAGFADLAVGEEATAIGRLRRLDDAGDDRFGHDHHLVLDAAVIEEGPLGTFRRIAGTTGSGVDALTGQFQLGVASGQGFGTGTTLAVQLYELSHIFARAGQPLTRDDLVAGLGARVDGVLVLGADDVLRSPLVVLDTGSPPAPDQLEGQVVATDPLIVSDGTADRCVDASGAQVFLVSTSDGFSSTAIDAADLVPGQAVSMFGREDIGGCFIAGTILADAD